jgi:hypothetical protein
MNPIANSNIPTPKPIEVSMTKSPTRILFLAIAFAILLVDSRKIFLVFGDTDIMSHPTWQRYAVTVNSGGGSQIGTTGHWDAVDHNPRSGFAHWAPKTVASTYLNPRDNPP